MTAWVRRLCLGVAWLLVATLPALVPVSSAPAAAQSATFGQSLTGGGATAQAVSSFGGASAVVLAPPGATCERTETRTEQQTTTQTQTQTVVDVWGNPVLDAEGNPQTETVDVQVTVNVQVDVVIEGTWREVDVDADGSDGDDDDHWVNAFVGLTNPNPDLFKPQPGVRYTISICVRNNSDEVMEAESGFGPKLVDGLAESLTGEDGIAGLAAERWLEDTVIRWDSQPARNHHHIVGLPTWFWVPPEDWSEKVVATATSDERAVPELELADDEILVVTVTGTKTAAKFAWEPENEEGAGGAITCTGAPTVWTPGQVDGPCTVDWEHSRSVWGRIEVRAVALWDLHFEANVLYRDDDHVEGGSAEVNVIWEDTQSNQEGLWDVALDGEVPDSHKLDVAEVLTFGFSGETAFNPDVDPPSGPTTGGKQIGKKGCAWYAVICNLKNVVINVIDFFIPDFIQEAITACVAAGVDAVTGIVDILTALDPRNWSDYINDFNDIRNTLEQAHAEGRLIAALTEMGLAAGNDLLQLDRLKNDAGEWDLSLTNVSGWIGYMACTILADAFMGAAAAKLADLARGARTWLNKRRNGTDSGPADNEVNGTTCTFNPVTSSFPAGTLVLLADGSHAAIETIRPGQQVLAHDVDAGTWQPRLVLDQWSHPDTGPLSTVTLVDGTRVTATDDHLFWVTTTETWTELQHVEPGHELLTPTGSAAVAAVWTSGPQDTTVWELHVEADNNFAVAAGDNDVLVHNAKPSCGDRDLEKDLEEYNPNKDQVDYEGERPYTFLNSDPKRKYREHQEGDSPDRPTGPLKGGWGSAPNPKNWVDKHGPGSVREAPDGGLIFIDSNGVAVHYNIDGYPDFSPHAVAEVDIQMPPNPDGTCCKAPSHDGSDFKLANEGVQEGGWGNQAPEGYTWHHASCDASGSCTMQLVPEDIHGSFPHAGPVSDAKGS